MELPRSHSDVQLTTVPLHNRRNDRDEQEEIFLPRVPEEFETGSPWSGEENNGTQWNARGMVNALRCSTNAGADISNKLRKNVCHVKQRSSTTSRCRRKVRDDPEGPQSSATLRSVTKKTNDVIGRKGEREGKGEWKSTCKSNIEMFRANIAQTILLRKTLSTTISEDGCTRTVLPSLVVRYFEHSVTASPRAPAVTRV